MEFRCCLLLLVLPIGTLHAAPLWNDFNMRMPANDTEAAVTLLPRRWAWSLHVGPHLAD